MASPYFKPDVEVLQEFRNLNPNILRATLQSIIIGPSYQKIKDPDDLNSTEASIGSYLGAERELPFPALSPGAVVLEDSLSVTIKNYAGVHVIPKTTLRTQGNSGATVAAELKFTDNNQDFVALGVVASASVSDHDGDFVHIIGSAAAGYYEIQQVVDSHTLVVDDPEGKIASLGNLSALNYTIGNFGWLKVDITPTVQGILLSPRLSDSGTVYLSGLARRTDYTGRLVVAESIYDLENVFDEPVTRTNPLAYGMSKTLASLGAGELCLGLMVEDDSVIAYQKALEVLEAEEVYCIVPLSTNPIVHQLVHEHVKAMSDVLQKKERIGLFNTARYNRVVKSGYFGRQNLITGEWGIADGNILATGDEYNDVVQFNHEVFNADGSGSPQTEVIPAGYDRAAVYFRPGADYVLTYALNSAPLIDVPITLNDDGVWTMQLTGDTFANIKFTSTAAHAEKCVIFYAKTINPIPGAEIFYPVIMPNGTQMDQPYLNPVSPDHYALKIHHYDLQNPTNDSEVGLLPFGMTLRVNYGNGQHSDVTTAGIHAFAGKIQSVYVFNNPGAVDADDHLIEVAFIPNAGDYEITTLNDPEATFLSDGIIPGEDELVIVDTNVVDQSTFSQFKETRYKIFSVSEESTLKISQVYNESTGEFEPGWFPSIAVGVNYRVETPIISDKYQLARWYSDISAGFANRRMSHIYAPAVGVSDDGITVTPVPGYYFACAYAGATQAEAPQQGFTNRPFAGFSRVFFTNDYFTEAQLNIIAEGGTTIVIQNRALAPLSVRHQLTTDRTSIETQEYSVTKNVDHMAKTARLTFRPYLGRYLITEATLDLLYSVGSALVARWKRNGQLLSGSVDRFQVDPTQADKVIACFKMKVPIPLNYIRLIFVI